MDSVPIQRESDRLSQAGRVRIIENLTAATFVCVHDFQDLRNGFHCFSFLTPLDRKESFLSQRSWDLRNDDFTPAVQCVDRGLEGGGRERQIYYLQRGNEIGAEALVRTRYYWKNYPSQIEIAEEFRLFWNLYQDPARNVFLHCDVHGTEHEVVRISDRRVEVGLRFLVDYLRAKQMHLALQFEGNYWSPQSLEELGLSPGRGENTGDLFHWWFDLSSKISWPGYKSISLLSGKAIIPCPGEITYDDSYQNATRAEFIVGQDATGQPVTATWEEGDNSGMMTPVFFHRAVLRKYFSEPEKYEVGDCDLRCSGFWSLRMDNDQPNRVVAWLRDLGQSLSPAECQHWRTYNIIPDGGFSRSFYTRNVRAWFADPEMPDLRLKQLYLHVNQLWSKQYGWPLWRAPDAADEYVFRQAHVCLDDNQAEFDQQNGLLAKLVVDFLNQSEIRKLWKNTDPEKKANGISLLEAFLLQEGFVDANGEVEKLRAIQNLRSAGAAHAKGKTYTDALKRARVQGLPLVTASMNVFQLAVSFTEWMRTTVLKFEDTGPPPLDLGEEFDSSV